MEFSPFSEVRRLKVTECTIADGKACAQLISLMRAGKWELSGSDWDTYRGVVQWVHSLATSMASDLKEKGPKEKALEDPVGGFRVKSMGTLPGKLPGKKTKKKG